MEKGDGFAPGTGHRLFIDQGASRCPGLVKLLLHIVTKIGDVVESFAPLVKKPGNGAVLIHGFQQFYVGFTEGEERGAHFLRGHLFYPLAVQSQHLFIKDTGLFNGVDGNADVIDFFNHKFFAVSELLPALFTQDIFFSP
jgi:hypothetical protein